MSIASAPLGSSFLRAFCYEASSLCGSSQAPLPDGQSLAKLLLDSHLFVCRHEPTARAYGSADEGCDLGEKA
jgi:hypothetical protein